MKKVFLLSGLLFLSFLSYAQYNGPAQDTLNCNEISAAIFPQSSQFYYSDGNPSFEFPQGTHLSTLSALGLWIGGIGPDNQLYLAADRYYQNGHDFWSGPFSNTGSESLNHSIASEWFQTWKITKEQIIDHSLHYQDPSYTMPDVIHNWPAHGLNEYGQADDLAPYVDVDEDGEYHPGNGDYPLMKGDESIFFIINDHMEHTESGGKTLGVEIQCMAWVYCDGILPESYQNTVFLSYNIFNRSEQDYHNTYLGVFADFDIGKSDDDYVGCHVENGNFFAYNADDWDAYYEDQIPIQACAILAGPWQDSDLLDNPSGLCDQGINGLGFGDGIIDNERLGMSRFSYFNNSGDMAMTDPSEASDYYHYMQGIWKDGSPMLYGGNGYISSGALGPEARFMFPNESDSCHWGTNGMEPNMSMNWTEETYDNDPGDRRGLASMGPFTFKAGSVHSLDVALVTAMADQKSNSSDLLQDYITEIKADYQEYPEGFGNQYIGQEELINTSEKEISIFPNPVIGDQLFVTLPIAGKGKYHIYNSTGQMIQSGVISAQKEQGININQLRKGWYVLEIEIEEQIFIAKLIK